MSVLLHGLTLLALVCLLRRAEMPTPPAETTIAMVFAPMPAQVDAAPAPEEPAPAAPPPVEQAAPMPAQPEPAVAAPPPMEQPAPLPAPPEPKIEAVTPPIPQPVPSERSPPRRAAVPRPPTQATRTTNAPTSTSVATSMAPLLPARPVAGMESDRPPVYPDTARRRGQQGRVLLQVKVSAEGTPVAVTVAESSGFASLDAAALTAVQQWRFVPATTGGTPVAAVAEVPVRFRLTN